MATKLKDAEPADYPNQLRVKNYNPEADDLYEKLGLTDDDRLNRIIKSGKALMETEDTQADAIAKISNMVESANELAYVMFIMGDNYSPE